MTKALEEAFRAASKLSDSDQDALAKAIQAEIRSEEEWERAFAGSRDILEELAEDALREHRAGRTQPVDPEKM